MKCFNCEGEAVGLPEVIVPLIGGGVVRFGIAIHTCAACVPDDLVSANIDTITHMAQSQFHKAPDTARASIELMPLDSEAAALLLRASRGAQPTRIQ